MGSTYGNNFQFAIFGESHAAAVGGVLSGVPAGIEIDFGIINFELRRRNHRASYSTPRDEQDKYEVLSGITGGITTGSPIAFIIRNSDTKSRHYDEMKSKMRPGHADYPAFVKHHGFNDIRGGGHFSGRLTAPLVFAGGIARQLIKNVKIVSHIQSIGDIAGDSLLEKTVSDGDITRLNNSMFPVLNDGLKEKMLAEITKYQSEGNSVGGVIECLIYGLDAGIGEPFFNSVESEIASLMFSIPAIKGIEFGKGFDITKMCGFDANDKYYFDGDQVKIRTNNNGGITGGLTNGMPVCFRVAVKPTPSVSIEQDTIDVTTKTNTKLTVTGRHDACIVPRAAAAVEAAAALAILNLL